MSNPYILARTCLSLLAYMASCTYVTLFTCLHLHCLLTWLQSVYSPNCHSMNSMLTVPAVVLSSLQGWTEPHRICVRVPFLPSSPDKMIITDLSLVGWGVHLDDHMAQGTWTARESRMHPGAPSLEKSMTILPSFHPLP